MNERFTTTVREQRLIGTTMGLMLHPIEGEAPLSHHYGRAFSSAMELFVVSAYLTDWDETLTLSLSCRKLRIITGKDFGITRKAACEAVLRWLPARRKADFLVADRIGGFHPKAVFWKEADGETFAIVGSSNLTRAAFGTNYEANFYSTITSTEFAQIEEWIAGIERECVPVSEDWLAQYNEAPRSPGQRPGSNAPTSTPIVALPLPLPSGMAKLLAYRRGQLLEYAKYRSDLIKLFRQCAGREINNKTFYERLPAYWSHDIGDRLQGAGWERTGSGSDFHALSESFLQIVDAKRADRDDVVVRELDNLARLGVASRKAFLSEMLCLRFPDAFPVLNSPVLAYLKAVKFRAPRGATEGVRYLDLARKLRFSLRENPDHPAKNLAELDTVIWKKYGKK